jgi:hypothetical protein
MRTLTPWLAIPITLSLTVAACTSPAPTPAELAPEESDVLFDTVAGAPSTMHLFHVSNDGGKPTGRLTVKLRGDLNAFSITEDQCSGFVLQPKGSCGVYVSLANETPDNYRAQLHIGDDFGVMSVDISMTGRVSEPGLRVDVEPTNVVEGTTAAAVVTVTNSGGGRTGLLAVSLATGTLEGDICSGTTLASGGTCTFGVRFAAPFGTLDPVTVKGSVSAAPGGIAPVAVTFKPKAAAPLQVSGGDFGTVDPARSIGVYVTITNPSDGPAGPLVIALGGPKGTPTPTTDPFHIGPSMYDGCSNVTLNAKETCQILVVTDTSLPTPGNYSMVISASAPDAHTGYGPMSLKTVLRHGIVTLTKSGSGDGTIYSSTDYQNHCTMASTACGTTLIFDNEDLTLTATAAFNSHFVSWATGPCAGSTSTTCTFKGANHGNFDVSAVFSQ